MQMNLNDSQLEDIKINKTFSKEHLAGYTDIEEITRFSLRLPISLNTELVSVSRYKNVPKQQLILQMINEYLSQNRIKI